MSEIIKEAMATLEGIAAGGIGANGPTLKELDDHVEATGRSWEDDADYHTAQRAWRLLEAALKEGGK